MPAPSPVQFLFTMPWGPPDWVGSDKNVQQTNAIWVANCLVNAVVGLWLMFAPEVLNKIAQSIFAEEQFDVDEYGTLAVAGYTMFAPGFYYCMAMRMKSLWMHASQWFLQVVVRPLLVLMAFGMGHCRASLAVLYITPDLLFSIAVWLLGNNSIVELLKMPFTVPVPCGPPALHHTFSLICGVIYGSTAIVLVLLPHTFSAIVTTIFSENSFSEKGIRGLATMGIGVANFAYPFLTLQRTRSNQYLTDWCFGRAFLVPGNCFLLWLMMGTRLSLAIIFSILDPGLTLIHYVLWCFATEDPATEITSTAYVSLEDEDKGDDRMASRQNGTIYRNIAAALLIANAVGAALRFSTTESIAPE